MKKESNKKFNKLLLRKDMFNIAISILIISLLSLIGVAVLQFLIVIDTYLYNSNEKQLSNRTLLIDRLENEHLVKITDLDDLKIDHVLEVQDDNYELASDFRGLEEYTDFIPDSEIILKGITTNKLYNLLKGKELDYSKIGQAVCPKDFLPISTLDYENYVPKDYIDGNLLLNKIIKTKYGNFEIVGVYENNELFFEKNICFVTSDSIKNFVSKYDSSFSSIWLIVDKAENLNIVKTNLENMGYIVSSAVSYDNSYLFQLHLIPIVIFLVVFILLFVSISFIVKRNISKNKEQIKLFKAIGYNNATIEKYYNQKYTITIFVSFILSFILYLVLVLFFKEMMSKNITLSYFRVNISPFMILILGILNLLIPYVYMKKALNKHLKIDRIIITGE